MKGRKKVYPIKVWDDRESQEIESHFQQERIYDRQLTEIEIKAIMDSPYAIFNRLSPQAKGLVVW